MHHAKGLAYQSEAELATREGRDVQLEEELVMKAIYHYEQALINEESFVSSMFHLGLMQRRTANFTGALQMFTKVQEKLPQDKSVYVQRGLVL